MVSRLPGYVCVAYVTSSASCVCMWPAFVWFCSDSAPIPLHSAVMLKCAYYAKYFAGIIRICLVVDLCTGSSCSYVLARVPQVKG